MALIYGVEVDLVRTPLSNVRIMAEYRRSTIDDREIFVKEVWWETAVSRYQLRYLATCYSRL